MKPWGSRHFRVCVCVFFCGYYDAPAASLPRHRTLWQDLAQTMVGTIRYMSPERLAGTGYGVAADVWSLGVVLLEMAARSLPFDTTVSQIELHDILEVSGVGGAVGCGVVGVAVFVVVVVVVVGGGGGGGVGVGVVVVVVGVVCVCLWWRLSRRGQEQVMPFCCRP